MARGSAVTTRHVAPLRFRPFPAFVPGIPGFPFRGERVRQPGRAGPLEKSSGPESAAAASSSSDRRTFTFGGAAFSFFT